MVAGGDVVAGQPNRSAQQTHIASFSQCLLAIIDVEFAKQIVDMGFDRTETDEQ